MTQYSTYKDIMEVIPTFSETTIDKTIDLKNGMVFATQDDALKNMGQ